MVDLPADDFADNVTDNISPFGRILVGSSARGTLESVADTDWFAVQLNKGITYSFMIKNYPDNRGISEVDINLRDAKGSSISWSASDSFLIRDSKYWRALEDGIYYVQSFYPFLPRSLFIRCQRR